MLEDVKTSNMISQEDLVRVEDGNKGGNAAPSKVNVRKKAQALMMTARRAVLQGMLLQLPLQPPL